jgi:serine/threonine protein kinase
MPTVNSQTIQVNSIKKRTQLFERSSKLSAWKPVEVDTVINKTANKSFKQQNSLPEEGFFEARLFQNEGANPNLELQLNRDSSDDSSSSSSSEVSDESLTEYLSETLSNFEWGEKLGEGAFGSVHVVNSDSFEGAIALKKMNIKTSQIIGGDMEKQGDVLGLLLNSDRLVSAKGFATVDSDGILHFHLIHADFSVTHLQDLVGHRIVSVAYEYMVGAKSLDKIMEESGVSPEEARQIGEQILDGLQVLHENRLIYRDLKPENTLITSEGVKLIDWNTVILADSDDQKISGFSGTPGYFAPELFGKRGYGKEADIYSFGVLLYELNYGEFEGDSDIIFDPKNWHKGFVESLKSKGEHLDPKQKKQLNDLLKRLIHPNPKFRLPLALAKEHPYFTGKSKKMWRKSLQEWRQMRKNLSEGRKETRKIDMSSEVYRS